MRHWLAGLFMLLGLAPAHAVCTAGSLPFVFQNNTIADATQVNANFNTILSSVAANCAASGSNSDITALLGLTTPLAPNSGGTAVFVGGVTTGTNSIALATTVPNNFALTTGYKVSFIAGGTNPSILIGPTTLNVHATGPVAFFRKTQLGPLAMAGGEILTGNSYVATYDGTEWVLDTDTAQVGRIEDWAGATAPPGSFLTNGQAVSRAAYAALFSVIGSTYGAGDGVTTFNVPDYQGRVAVMTDGAGRISTSCFASAAVGTTCGAQSQTIAQANLPAVNLSSASLTASIGGQGTGVPVNSSAFSVSGPGVGLHAGSADGVLTSAVGGTVPLGGSGTALPIVQPTLIANKIIRY